MKWRVRRTAGKILRTSSGNIGHSIANACGKTVFHKVFVLWLRLARPTSRVRRAGQFTYFTHCVFGNCFCFWLLGILFGLIFFYHASFLESRMSPAGPQTWLGNPILLFGHHLRNQMDHGDVPSHVQMHYAKAETGGTPDDVASFSGDILPRLLGN